MARRGKKFGTVRRGRWRNVVSAGVMPVVLNGVLWPLALTQAPPALILAEPQQALWYVVPLVGIPLLARWVSMLVSTARWGSLHFELTGEAPAPGGVLRGQVVTGLEKLPGVRRGADAAGHAAALPPEYRVTLRCIAQRDLMLRSRQRRERVVTEVSTTVAMEEAITASGKTLLLPVDLAIPSDAPVTMITNDRGEGIWWELVVESTTLRPALQAVIRLPVVKTTSPGTAETGEGPRPSAEGMAAGTLPDAIDGAEATRLVSGEPRELVTALEKERTAGDPRSVAGRLVRPKAGLFRMGYTPSGELVAVSLRGDRAVGDLWSGLLAVVGVALVAVGMIPLALGLLVVIVALRALLGPVLVRVVAAPENLRDDRVLRRKHQSRCREWSAISSCKIVPGMQRVSRQGTIVKWDLLVQEGQKQSLLALRTETEEAAQALAEAIHQRARGRSGTP
ncbi:hypothetical protein [Alkalispirochaeta alkalica]|uniref:hypothetical protein n=1 Tax=Alkalispirochaeta alkalica TaxID=46356 RepID=UPI0012FE63A0|nr:hypothetical protein [Alkalispirochaeta alkalica]